MKTIYEVENPTLKNTLSLMFIDEYLLHNAILELYDFLNDTCYTTEYIFDKDYYKCKTPDEETIYLNFKDISTMKLIKVSLR